MATNANLLKMIQDLTARVVKLETAPPGTVDLTAIETRLTDLENHLCPQEDRIAALEQSAASEAAAQNVLEADHIPTP